jgi:hypothetical protein
LCSFLASTQYINQIGCSMRARQLWSVIRGATEDGLLSSSRQDELERGELIDISLLAPPTISLGATPALPCNRTAEYCIDRFFESAKNQNVRLVTMSPLHANVLDGEGALHHMLLQPDALGWFSCAFWAVVLCEMHLDSPSLSSQYVGALFLNMSLFLVRLLQAFPKLSGGAPLGLLDMSTAIAGAIVHTIHLISNPALLPPSIAQDTFRLSVERNVVWWVLGIDGVEAAKTRGAGVVAQRVAGSSANPTIGPPSPSRSATEDVTLQRAAPTIAAGLESTLTLQQQRLIKFEAKLDAITAQASLCSTARGRTNTRGLSASQKRNDAASDAQKPLLSRSVASKRAGVGDAGSGGNGPRATFVEIHQRVQLTREARRDVLEREAIALLEAKRQAQRAQEDADVYALAHQITGETWTGPQRHAIRSFHLNGMSPLVKFFLQAASEHSSERIFAPNLAAPSPSTLAGERDNMVSVFQRVSSSAVVQTSAAFGVPERRYRLPSCPDCKLELVRAKSITATCGRCSRPAATTSSASLHCEHCPIGYVCRSCAIPGGVVAARNHQQGLRSASSTADRGHMLLEPTALFGKDLSAAEWCCYTNEPQARLSRPSSAMTSGPKSHASHRRNDRSFSVSGTGERWSTLIQELLGTYRAETTPDQLTFNLYLREANHNINIDNKVEVRRALEEAAYSMMDAGGAECGSQDVANSKGDAEDHVHPSAPKALSRRPQSALSAPGALPAEEDMHSDLGAFMTGVPTSHAPRDPLTASTLLSRPMTPLRRPSSAFASRPNSAAVTRPVSALSRQSTSCGHRPAALGVKTTGVLDSIRQQQRPASAMSRASTSVSLAFGQDRPSSAASISWTTVAPKECAALERFRREAKDTMAGCMQRVAAINAECRATDEASTAASKMYKANISRYAVEHLQEVQRAMKAIERSERQEARRSMSTVTAAIELAAGVFHQPLRHMDAIKDALYTIDEHFEQLPESFRMFALRYTSEMGATLVSMIRDYKMTQRDQSQWPVSLDDTRCSRAREAEKYGAGAVYVSPARRGTQWRQVVATSRNAPVDAKEEPGVDVPTWDDGVDAGAAEGDGAISGDSPVDIDAMLRRQSDTMHSFPVEFASSVSRRSFDNSRVVVPDLNAPPSCMPATHVAGSDTLVLRSGVMMWDDTQQVVGKRAGDVRMRFLDKQRITPDDSWLQVQMVL